jgi:hypothetical protein
MLKKTLVLLFALIVFALLVGVAKAQIAVTIQVKDSQGNNIDGGTVNLNTMAYVTGSYSDLSGSNAPASAVLEVYFNGQLQSTLYSGSISSGGSVTEHYLMTTVGTYEFTWTCTDAASTGATAQCITERGMVTATVQLVVPEPASIAGLLMGLSALGLLAVKRTRHSVK